VGTRWKIDQQSIFSAQEKYRVDTSRPFVPYIVESTARVSKPTSTLTLYEYHSGSFSLPVELTKLEKEYCQTVSRLIDEVLKELKQGGWIRKEIDFATLASAQLELIMGRINAHAEVANALTFAFFTKPRKFSRSLQDLHVGFTHENIPSVWFYDLFNIFVEGMEMTRHTLLRMIADKKPFRQGMTLGQVVREITNVCPTFGKTFASEIDVELRNALAHGNYWLTKEGEKWILNYTETLGRTGKSEPLLGVAIRMRKNNLLGTTLTENLAKKMKSGWFKQTGSN
jgi:hypothetical protein